MATTNNLVTLDGNFKNVYADKIENLHPENTKLMQRVPFVKGQGQIGKQYLQPVVLGLEHGITYDSSGDAFTLDSAVAGQIKEAKVTSTEMVLRSRISVAAASRSMTSEAAFEQSTKFLVRNMLRSMTKRVEVGMMYGGSGIGEVGSLPGGTVIEVLTAEWAPGVWVGAEQMKIEFYDATLTTLRGAASVTAVNMTTRRLTLDAIPVGVIVTDKIFYKTAKGNEAIGVHKIISNTGLLFDINGANYSLWQGNSYSATNAPLSFAKLQDSISRAVEKGLDSAVLVLVNPRTWSDLLTEQAALRQYDSSYSVQLAEAGHQEIVFYGQNGKIEIVSSIYCKEGFAYVLCLEEMQRIGSSDITFNRPGAEGKFFRELENENGYELRAYSDQALFCFAPGKNCLISDIVN